MSPLNRKSGAFSGSIGGGLPTFKDIAATDKSGEWWDNRKSGPMSPRSLKSAIPGVPTSANPFETGLPLPGGDTGVEGKKLSLFGVPSGFSSKESETATKGAVPPPAGVVVGVLVDDEKYLRDDLFTKEIAGFGILEFWEMKHVILDTEKWDISVYKSATKSSSKENRLQRLFLESYFKVGPLKNEVYKGGKIHYFTISQHPSYDPEAKIIKHGLEKADTIDTVDFDEKLYTDRVFKTGSFNIETITRWRDTVVRGVMKRRADATHSITHMRKCPVLYSGMIVREQNFHHVKVQSASTEAKVFPIHFKNGWTQKLMVVSNQTARKQYKILRELLKIQKDEAYHMYIVPKSGDTEQLIEMDENIWEKYNNSTAHITYRQSYFTPNGPADVESRQATDPNCGAHRLAMIYVVDCVLKGFFRIDFDEASTLASYMLYADYGPWEALRVKNPSAALEALLPELKNLRSLVPLYVTLNLEHEELEREIFTKYSQIPSKFSRLDVEKMYMRLCQTLPEFGGSFFKCSMREVKVDDDGEIIFEEEGEGTKAMICVSYDGIRLAHYINDTHSLPKDKKDWDPKFKWYHSSFEDIIKWVTVDDWRVFAFTTQAETEEEVRAFSCESYDYLSINKITVDYVNLQVDMINGKMSSGRREE